MDNSVCSINMNMKLSIITVCYNNLRGLERTYRSVMEQTVRKDFEWIVVDGASTDGTSEFLQEHCSEINHYVSESDTGIFNAMNKGIRMASGEYLFFLNSGDTLNGSDIISLCLPLLDGTDLIYGEQRTYDPNINKFGHFAAPDTFRPVNFVYSTLPHQATFIRAKLHQLFPYREDIGIMGDFIFFAEQIILFKATQKKIPYSAGIFCTDGVSMKDWASMMRMRKEIFIKCFSQSLYDDLCKLEEYEQLPFLHLNKKVLKIKCILGKIKSLIFE